MWILLCTFILSTSVIRQPLASAAVMDTAYKWKFIDYTWESEAMRQAAIDAGEYNYTQVVPMDVDKAPDGRVFVSIDGTRGVPAVLVTITDQMGPSGPLVRPYPDWSYFKKGDCDSIQSVYRIAIDKCERLWVLDAGYLDNEPVVCQPQLLTFDLKTNRLIQRIKIPENVAKGRNGQSLLATPIVETHGRACEDTTVYIADPFGFGLIIWNNGNLFRLENPLFEPSKDASNITSGDRTVEWSTGIVTMAISPKIFPGETSFLYFHSLSSFDLYAGITEVLKRSRDGKNIRFFGAKNVLSSQAIGMAFSSEGTLFMGLTKESAITCWNRYREWKPEYFKIIAQDSQRLEYVNGMKVIQTPSMTREELWILSNRLLAAEEDQLDFSDYNYYILKQPIHELISGTACEMPHKTRRSLETINKEHDDVLIFSN